MKSENYKWMICAGCTLLLFCTIGLLASAFSVYLPYMITDGGMSKTQASTILSLRSVFALLAMLFVDKFLNRTDIRLGVTIAVASGSLSLILLSMTHSFIGYSLAIVFAGISYGLGGMIPVSIIINRWFKTHTALAIGICAAGTGAATIVSPPLITVLVENMSLKFAFLAESAFFIMASIIVFIVLRNRPEEKEPKTVSAVKVNLPNTGKSGEDTAGRGTMVCILIGIILIGVTANGGFQHLPLLYKTAGFDSMTVSLIYSFVGIVVTGGKCLYGEVTDRLGTYKSGFIFFSLFIAGFAVCSFAGTLSLAVALVAMIFLGTGIPLSTVGLSMIARDMAGTVGYLKTVKRYQIAQMVGAILFTPVPGIIADLTGSYVPAYALMCVFAIAAMILIQVSYKRTRNKTINSANQQQSV